LNFWWEEFLNLWNRQTCVTEMWCGWKSHFNSDDWILELTHKIYNYSLLFDWTMWYKIFFLLLVFVFQKSCSFQSRIQTLFSLPKPDKVQAKVSINNCCKKTNNIALCASLTNLNGYSNKLIKFQNPVTGWDLYGRMPYDDWLFTNWRLTNPNLLKRTIIETVLYLYSYYLFFGFNMKLNSYFIFGTDNYWGTWSTCSFLTTSICKLCDTYGTDTNICLVGKLYHMCNVSFNCLKISYLFYYLFCYILRLLFQRWIIFPVTILNIFTLASLINTYTQ
jgi:hypothetical protein